jgi:ATP phosphoribosyltransferase
VIAAVRDTSSDRRLRIAVPKGALFADSVRMLGAAGLDVSALADPGRNLVIQGGEVEYVIAKPTDVPIYVAYGATDCGIGGKDVLVESALDVVELVDLGFGGCRFVVAESEGSPGLLERYRHLGVVRVATKYPRIATDYFTGTGRQAEIVEVKGSVELAPLTGLVEAIVDLTATGTTLKENGLVIREELFASTARLIANPVAHKLKAAEIDDMLRRLRAR